MHLISEDDIFVLLYLSGVANTKLAEELHKVQDPTPDLLFRTAEAWEVAQSSRKALANTQNASANVAHTRQASNTKNSSAQKGNNSQHRSQTQNRPTTSFQRTHAVQNVQNFNCYRCGSEQQVHTCAGLTATCSNCGKKGHLRGVCRSRAKAATDRGPGTKPKAMATTTAVSTTNSSASQATGR